MKQQLLATVALLGASLLAGNAYADPVDVSGTATFADTSTGNNGLSLKAQNSPINLTDLIVGTPLSVSDFITISFIDSNFSGTQSDSIAETFTFALADGTTGSAKITGTGTENPSLFSGAVGSVTWTPIDAIQLSDGAELQISLSNPTSDTGYVGGNNPTVHVDATFTLVQGPSGSQGNGVDPVPEPASLALLGSALTGLGLFGRRSKRPVA